MAIEMNVLLIMNPVLYLFAREYENRDRGGQRVVFFGSDLSLVVALEESAKIALALGIMLAPRSMKECVMCGCLCSILRWNLIYTKASEIVLLCMEARRNL